MHSGIVQSTKYLQDLREQDIANHIQGEIDRRDTRRAHRLRRTIGHRLIALGSLLVENPSSELGDLERAA